MNRSLSSFRPLADNVLIRFDIARETAGGLMLSDNSQVPKSGYCVGTVAAVGPGYLLANGVGVRIPLTVKVGDVVLFDIAAGKRPRGPEWNGDEAVYFFVEERNILGVA